MSTKVVIQCDFPISTRYSVHKSPSTLGVLSLLEGGGQTQDGLSILSSCGYRLWDNLQRLCVQLHAGLRGHTHDEVRVSVYPPPGFFYYFLSRTTFSSNPHRRWEGGDPGVANQKSPTCLLLTPDVRFHSFGFAARDFYHDLDPEEARHWLYFDKFKMKIHSTSVRGIRRTRGEDKDKGSFLHVILVVMRSKSQAVKTGFIYSVTLCQV